MKSSIKLKSGQYWLAHNSIYFTLKQSGKGPSWAEIWTTLLVKDLIDKGHYSYAIQDVSLENLYGSARLLSKDELFALL